MKAVAVVLFIFFFHLAQTVFGQGGILNINALQDSIKASPKPAMLLIHTDWCTYCALQKRQLEKRGIPTSVYIGEFNAEHKGDVVFKDKIYSFKPTGRNAGLHELVLHLLGDKKVSYPIWIILDNNLNPLAHYTGYLRPDELDGIIKSLSDGTN